MIESGRGRRRGVFLLNLLIVLILSLTAVVVFFALRARDNSDGGSGSSPARVSEVGPGTYTDKHEKMKFNIPADWEVVREADQTRVRPVNGELPGYTMESRSMEDLNLVANWNCLTLPNLMPQGAEAAAIWPAKVMYIDIPCTQDASQPAYARVYYTLEDGSDRLAVVLLGPLDGLNWTVARSDPFTGDWPMPLIDAMTESVVTSRR